MTHLDLLPGDSIDRAAVMLVRHAPARADFNGVAIRARYATTKPRDIVARYHHLLELRVIQWQASPAGRAHAEQDAHEIREAQAALDAAMADLHTLDFASLDAVLAWIDRVIDPLDRVGVRKDTSTIRTAFEAHGYLPNDYTGDAFDGEDEAIYARWIVGQVLDMLRATGCVRGGMRHFIAEWRTKFGPTA